MNQLDDIADIYELSPLQQGMLFHCLYAPESGLYIEQISVPLRERINAPAFGNAWQQGVDRHSALRTSFHWEDLSKPLQVVHRAARVPLQTLDWRSIPPSGWRPRLDALLQSDRAKGFNLTSAPLLRITIIQLTEDAVQLILTFHHLLLDGWSLQIVLRDFTEFYDSACQLKPARVEPVRPYGDYIAWVQAQDSKLAEAFWRRTLGGFAAPTILRVGRLTWPETEESSHGEEEIRLSSESTADLQTLAKQHQLTVNTITQGAWAILLSRHSGEYDVLFGTIVSGRPASLPGVEGIVGLFINTLPVRAKLVPEESLLIFLKRLRDDTFGARNYEYSSLMEIQGWSEIPRGTPLYESILVFENYPIGRSATSTSDGGTDSSAPAGDLSFQCVERTNVPLTVTLTPGPRFSVKIVYDRRRFTGSIVQRILEHFRFVLEEITTDPTRSLRQLPLLSKEESQWLASWNATGRRREYAFDPGIYNRFEAIARSQLESTAFICGDTRLRYFELEEKAGRIYRHLRACQVAPEVKVAVCLERGLEVPAVLLAVFRAGGVYVPLDPAYPMERLALMLEVAKPSVLLTDTRLAGKLPARQGLKVLCLDALDWEAPPAAAPDISGSAAVSPNSLAYITFTSGTTGRPKGVAVEHRQILNRLLWMWEDYPFRAGDVACQKTALSFVDSLWELLGPLLRGIPTVIIRDEVVRDPVALVSSLGAHGVTSLWLVPSLLHALLEAFPQNLAERLPALRFWVSSGEALSIELYRRFRSELPGATLFNLYGTSEVWDATWYAPDASEDPGTLERVPIGRPIANVQVYVIDSNRQLVPVGVPGELCVGGDGLARGYLETENSSDDRIIPNPFVNDRGARVYRTGDQVRWREDGQLEYLGRLDRQVKVRGFRIEPGEIEAALEQHEQVRRAVVTAKGEGASSRLVAYIEVPNLADDATRCADELRRFLPTRVPEFMVPSEFVVVSSLPLTPSGKVDARALQSLDGVGVNDAVEYEAPRNEVEQRVADVFAEVLGVARVGVRDHFFARLGGNSLQATQVTSRVRNAFAVEVPLRRLFETPTPAEYAVAIEELLISHLNQLSDDEAQRLALATPS